MKKLIDDPKKIMEEYWNLKKMDQTAWMFAFFLISIIMTGMLVVRIIKDSFEGIKELFRQWERL